MRISDWSSDVCSSDLIGEQVGDQLAELNFLASENHTGFDRPAEIMPRFLCAVGVKLAYACHQIAEIDGAQAMAIALPRLARGDIEQRFEHGDQPFDIGPRANQMRSNRLDGASRQRRGRSEEPTSELQSLK